MTTGIIIQARLGSTRLPAKVLLPLPTGKTVIAEIVSRCMAAKVDVVAVAVPSADVKAIRASVKPDDRRVWVVGCDGDESDVLARYDYVAGLLNLDVVVRITGDCPMIQTDVIDETVALRDACASDYASNVYPVRSYPRGWDVEVFTRATLTKAHKAATTDHDREHVTPIMQQDNGRKNRRISLMKAMVDRNNESVTLDTLDDYRKLWGMTWGI